MIPTCVYYGETVKALRTAYGITLPDLAAKAGISKGLLSKIEKGKGNPTLLTMQRLSDALPFHWMISPGPREKKRCV